MVITSDPFNGQRSKTEREILSRNALKRKRVQAIITHFNPPVNDVTILSNSILSVHMFALKASIF